MQSNRKSVLFTLSFSCTRMTETLALFHVLELILIIYTYTQKKKNPEKKKKKIDGVKCLITFGLLLQYF